MSRVLHGLDVARDVPNIVVTDEALPRRHRRPLSSVPNDPKEVVLRSLECPKICGGRGTFPIGPVALRALGQVGRPGRAQLQSQRRGLGPDLRQRDPVSHEDIGDLLRLKLSDRLVDDLLELSIALAHGRADLELTGRIADLDRLKAGVLLDEPAGERRLHDRGFDLAVYESAEDLLGTPVDLPDVSTPV